MRWKSAALFVLGIAASVRFAFAALDEASLAEVAPAAAPRAPFPTSRVVAQIDAALAAEWEAQGLVPAAPASDATWLRRLSIDLLGTIPAADEVIAFLADPAPDKRDRTIDAYLVDRRCAENLAALWSHLLLSASGVNEAKLTHFLQRWLADALANGAPFDAIVRDLTCSSGTGDDPGPMAFQLAYYDTLETLAGVTARAFLGLQIQCAQCHDHPFDRWKRDEFNRFAGFLLDMHGDLRVPVGKRVATWTLINRAPERELQAKLNRLARAVSGDGAMGGGADDAMAAAPMASDAPAPPLDADRVAAIGEALRLLRRGDRAAVEAVLPRLPDEARELVVRYRDQSELFGTAGHLDGAAYQPVDGQSRRAALAAWLTAPDNPWFAQALVNRAWGHLFGRGLIEPVDDLTASKDRVLPELLQALGAEFAAGGFDLRALFGALVRTRAYGLAATTTESPEAAVAQERRFAARTLRPLTPEQLARALEQAAAGQRIDGSPTSRSREQQRLLAELVDRVTAIDANEERRVGASIPQALFLMNGRYSHRSGELKKGGRLERFLDAKRSPVERLRDLWCGTLGRPPSEAEATALFAALAPRRDDATRAFDDLFWALLNSAEFQTHH
ncbi:MAG: DUF1549 domain-containing protein [Planctomycetes bacterium]|nr:DUF1549 domain-containing protein [Planctomycetota bacterium]